MEEIEYLEEYEDLVLPAINSAAGAAANANSSLDNDGSSSSLDQDIFNCLFDDNSDDDNDEPHQPLKEQIICPQKDARHYLDKANDALNDLGDQISKELLLENRTKNSKEKDSTKAPKQVAIHSKVGGTKIEEVSSSASSIAKTVATVRPTVQQIVNYKKPSIDKKIAATSKQNSSKLLQGHNFAGSQTSPSAKNKFNTRHQTKSSVSKQRPATIVKPEKIITKDPAEDPLNVDASSPDESANYSVSDISGETYNSISDFDDDDDDDYDFAGYVDTLDDDDDESVQSQVIDISNDSSESRSHIEELRGSTPSPVVSEDRCSLPKLMANREIIKSLLSKKEKPKLLNLINEHDKADTSINNSNEEERFVLSTTPEKSNNDLPTKHSMCEPSVLPANISEANTIDEHDLPSESFLLQSNAQDEKSDNLSDSTENSRSEIKSTNLMRNDGQTKEVNKNKRNDLPNEAKTSKRDNLEIQTSHSIMGKRDEQLMEKVNSDRKDSKSFEQSVHAQITRPCNSNQSPRNIVCTEKEDEVKTPILKEVRGEKESSDFITSAKVQKKRFRNPKTSEENYKEVSEIPLADRKCRQSDVDVENKTKEKSEQYVVSATVLKTSKQVNLESQTSHSKKDKIQEQSIEELNSNRKDSDSVDQTKQPQSSTLVKSNQSPRNIACSEKLDEIQTPILKEARGEKESSELTSAQPQRKRFRNPIFSKGSNEEESVIPILDSKCDLSDVDVRTIGVTGNSSLSAVESKTKEKPENKGSASIVKTSKQVSLESQTSQSKIGKKHEQSSEQTMQPQSSTLVKFNQSPRNIVCSEKFDEAKKPILKEVRSEKESPKLTSAQPQRKRFRNPSKGNERSNNEESELLTADNKCDRSEVDLVRIVDKTRNSSLLAVENKTKEKPEQNVSTSVLPRDSFKNPTKFDLSNRNTSNCARSCERLADSTRDILNKHVLDVPKGVIVNPFVQRTPKKILGSKDGKSKTPGESPRNNSRESSVESAKSSTKDHFKDNEKSCKSVRSETELKHNQQEHPKKSCEKSEYNLKPSDKVVYKNKSKEIDTKIASPLDPTKIKDTTKNPIDLGEAEIKTKYPSSKNYGKNSLDNMHKDQKTSSEKKGTTEKPSRSTDGKLSRSTDEKSQQHKKRDKGYIISKTLPNVDNVEKFANKDKVDSKGNDPKSQKQLPVQSIPSTHDLSKSEKHLNKTLNSPREISVADVSHKTPFSTFKKTSADAGKDCTMLNVRKEPNKSHSKEDVLANKLSSTSECKKNDKMELKTIAKQMETSKSISPKQLASPSHSPHNAVNKKSKEKFVKASTEVEQVCSSSLVSMESDKLKIKVDSNILKKTDITVEEKKQLKPNSANSASKQSSKEISETSALGTRETLSEGISKLDVSKVTKVKVRDAGNRKELEKYSKNSRKSEIAEQFCADAKIKHVSEKPTTKLRKSENLTLKVEDEKIVVHRKPTNTIKNSKSVENVCKQSVLKDIKSSEKQDSAGFKDEIPAATSTNKTFEPKVIESRQGDKLNDPPICEIKKESPAKPVQIATATQMLEQCHDDDDNAKKNNKLKKNNNLALGTRKENICLRKELDVPHIGMEKNNSQRNSSAISLHSNTNELSDQDAKGVSDHKNEQNVEMFVEPVDDCNKSEVNQHVNITCSTVAEKSSIMDIKNPDSTIEIIPTVQDKSTVENENVDGLSVKPKATTKENSITTPQNDGTLENAEENITCKSVTQQNNRKTRSSKPDEARFSSEIKIPSNSLKTLSSKDVVTENIPFNTTTQIKQTSSAEDFNQFEKDQLEKQIKTERLQEALADETNKMSIEIKPTVHHEKSTVENENVDGRSVKPKATAKENTVTTLQNDEQNTEENVTCILIKSVTQNNRKTRSSKPDGARFSAETKVPSNPTTTISSKDVVIENTPSNNTTAEMKKNSPPGEFDKFEKDQLEKHNNEIPHNAFAKTNTEPKVPCNPLKTISSKCVIIENIPANNTTQANKVPASEFDDTFQIDQLEKQSNNESPTEAFAETIKLCETEPQAEGKSANQCMRITRSSATTEDDAVSEAAYSFDDTKSHSPYNLKTNDSTSNKTPLRTVRRNRNTPSKGEGLGESSQTQEPVVLKIKSKSLDESTQGSLSTIAKDKNELNRSPQKRTRITRCTLGSKRDDTSKSSGFENNVLKSKHGDVLSPISANKEKTSHSSNSAVKKSENKTVDFHPDKVETSEMNATQITIEKKTSDTASESTLCINESSTKCKLGSSRDDANNKEWQTIAKKEITLAVEEAFKYTETLTPVELTRDCAAAITDSKLTDETTTTTTSAESLDTVIWSDTPNLSMEVSPSFADHSRRLRKRGSESPFCENRDGDDTAMFKTPTILTGTAEVKTKRRLRSPAAEKEVLQPLAKKTKIDKGKGISARNRNSDVVIPAATSESASKEFTEPSNETTISTVSESYEVVTPLRDPPSSIEIRSTEITTSQISTTFVDKVRLPFDNSPQCSHAETKEKEHKPEWLKGNDKNDSSQMQNLSNSNTHNTKTEREVTIKSSSLQEPRTRISMETTMPNQVTELHSNVSGQESSKRIRKLKSASTHNKDAPNNDESMENVTKTEENNSIQSQNIQRRGLVAHKVTEIVPPEEATKSTSKEEPPSTEPANISPKRVRKLRTVPPRERNNEATSCTNVMANKNELVANVDFAKQKSGLNTSRLEVCSDEKAKGITKDFAISSVTINCPPQPQKSERRDQMKTGQVQTLITINKDQQKIIKGIPSTKQDKKPNKRSEIDILIESMPKEMKDAGIKDLLNISGSIKRQRAGVKRSNNAESPAQSITASSPVVNPPEVKETKTYNDCGGGTSNSADDILKRSQTKRLLTKKLANTKNSNQSQSVNAEASPMQIEMEKTLIDEVEIKNMNTTNMLNLKTSHSLPTNDFKMPKMLTVGVNRQNTSNSLMNFATNRRPPTKCRVVKVRLNRRVVKKYFENFRKLDVTNSTVRFKTQGKSIQSKIIEPATSTNTCAITTLHLAREHHLLTEQQSEKNSEVEVSLPEVKEISTPVDEANFPTFERDSNSLKTTVSIAVVGSKNCSALYSTDNITGDNGRNVEDILAESIMEPTVPLELKNEFLDENPMCMGETTLPDTPTLIARSQTITQAAANALSNTTIPTDIRLLTNDPISTRACVPSFGVTPTLVDARGARMYTFLHPAKYSRNHGNVLLDYCCPNLDGPMPAIDPTRIHAQVQTPVIELPSCVVLTTKVVTRAELECRNSTIPDVIRKKADKIRSNISYHQTSGAPHETAVTDMPTAQFPSSPYLHQLQIAHSTTPEQNSQAIQQPTVIPAVKYPYFPNDQQLSPAVNALAKYLPSTTTITAKIRTPLSQNLQVPKSSKQNSSMSMVSVVPKGPPTLLNDTQMNLLRSNLRRIDVILKSLVQPFEKLKFTERHQVIDNLVASGKFLPKDVERAIAVTEEYLKQINLIEANQIIDAASSSSNIVTTPLPRQISNLNPIRMPPTLQLAPKLATTSSRTDSDPNLEEIRSTSVRKVQSTVRQNSATLNTSSVKQRQVPIYDTERNIIGYQLQVLTPNTNMPSYRKSSGGGSTSSLGASSNTQRKSLKRPAQDSPRVFYTSPPMQTSTPNANLNTTQYLIKPVAAAKNSQCLNKSQNGESIMTTSAGTEKTTTTTVATVKRVTRSRAAGGSKVIIVSKSNSNQETILPDATNHQAEIKHEHDVEDFIG